MSLRLVPGNDARMSGNATLTIVASMNASAAPAHATSNTADGWTVRRRTIVRAGTSVTATPPGGSGGYGDASADQVRRALTDHDRRRIRVPAGDDRHHGR